MKSLVSIIILFFFIHNLFSQGIVFNFSSEITLYNKLSNHILVVDKESFSFNRNLGKIIVNRPKSIKQILFPDKPWESYSIGFSSFFYEDGIYRLYYQVAIEGNNKRMMCLATSTDGKTWIKPDLGIVEFNGSYDNNIVLNDVFEIGSMFKAINKRGQLVYTMLIMKPDLKHYFVSSIDGLHFEVNMNPAFEYLSDTQNQTFFDINENGYFSFLRGTSLLDNSEIQYRKVVFSSNKNIYDLLQEPKFVTKNYRWGKHYFPAIDKELKTVMQIDYKFDKNKYIDIYTPSVLPYGKYYFAFPSIFYKDKFSPDLVDGVINTHLYFSNDAKNWSPLGLYLDETVMPNNKQIYMSIGSFLRGNEIVNFAYAAEGSHGKNQKNTKIYEVTQTIDRFTGLRSNKDKIFTVDYLKPINGTNRFSVNYKADSNNGYVVAEVLNAAGKIVFSQKLLGDEIDYELQWPGSLGRSSGNYYLRFNLHNADLYSITKTK